MAVSAAQPQAVGRQCGAVRVEHEMAQRRRRVGLRGADDEFLRRAADDIGGGPAQGGRTVSRHDGDIEHDEAGAPVTGLL